MNFIPCSYVGQSTADGRRFDGIGRYTFANGDVYVGGMQDGQFHGQGVIFFRDTAHHSPSAPIDAGSKVTDGPEDSLQAFLNPTPSSESSPNSAEGWSGQYRGLWDHGRHIEGQYVFQDGLIYGNEATSGGSETAQHFSSAAWTYCHGSDRRLWAEYLENVAPVLPHEALLGGAKLLHQRKQAAAAAAVADAVSAGATDKSTTTAAREVADGVGEGLPLVLPNAFVQARAAPAFASGQLCGVHDPRVVRWTAAAEADEAKRRQRHGNGRNTTASAEASPEMTQSTIALQLAMTHTTRDLPSQARQRGGGVDSARQMDINTNNVPVTGSATGSASPAKLNLSVCRVKDVEDVNRALVQVVPAPS